MLRQDLLSIGEFSRMSRLTVKALRHYDETGLLRPGFTDSQSGYRYYSSSQLPEAETIRLLRSLELPLEDIQQYLRELDAERRRGLLGKYTSRLEARMEQERGILASLKDLAQGEGGPEGARGRVEIKELASQPVLGVRRRIRMPEIDGEINRAYGAVFAHLGVTGDFPAGPPFTLYFDEEYKEEDMDVQFCVPVSRLMAGKGEVEGAELPGGRMASTLHAGPFDGVGEAYHAIMLWISRHGHFPTGPAREVYLVSPGQTQDPADWRTEILIPID